MSDRPDRHRTTQSGDREAGDRPTRRTFLGAMAGATSAVAGCTSLARLAPQARRQVLVNVSLNSLHRYVEGQPSFESVPAAECWLATRPEWLERNVRWDHIPDRLSRRDIKQLERRFDPGEHFLTVIASALPFDYELEDYRDPDVKDGVLYFYVRPSPASVGGGTDADPGEPKYAYNYTFTLWELDDGVGPPTDVELRYEGGELNVHTATKG